MKYMHQQQIIQKAIDKARSQFQTLNQVEETEPASFSGMPLNTNSLMVETPRIDTRESDIHGFTCNDRSSMPPLRSPSIEATSSEIREIEAIQDLLPPPAPPKSKWQLENEE